MQPTDPTQTGPRLKHPEREVSAFDFRRPDRISKSQLRAIYNLHETVARNVGSSLSAYLRAYLTANLVSVEQLSYEEFRDCLSSPTCLISLGLSPYEGNAILELSPALIFPFVEIVLGGNARRSPNLKREATEIELKLLDSLFRIILHDFQSAWKAAGNIEFTVDSVTTVSQALRVLAPQEAVVAVGIEIQIGDIRGMMNFAIPSVIIRMMRQKFDRQWSMRKAEPDAGRRTQILRWLRASSVKIDAILPGLSISFQDLLSLKAGDVLDVQCPTRAPLTLMVNGKPKYRGRLITLEGKHAFNIGEIVGDPDDAPVEMDA